LIIFKHKIKLKSWYMLGFICNKRVIIELCDKQAGLSLWVRPGLHEPVGYHPDQASWSLNCVSTNKYTKLTAKIKILCARENLHTTSSSCYHSFDSSYCIPLSSHSGKYIYTTLMVCLFGFNFKGVKVVLVELILIFLNIFK